MNRRLILNACAGLLATALSSCSTAGYNQALTNRFAKMSDKELMGKISTMHSDFGGVRRAAVAEAERRDLFRSPYEATAAAGRISIGMPEYLVRRAWGNPDEVNRTISAYGTREQWVYGGARGTIYSKMRFVYVEDGRVTLIQS